MEAISPVIQELFEVSGIGIVGFTIVYNDGTYKNIIQSFVSETKAHALSKINLLWQGYQADLSSAYIKKTGKSNQHIIHR